MKRWNGWCAALVLALTPAVSQAGGGDDKTQVAAAPTLRFEHEMPEALRRDWASGWTRARAYTFNSHVSFNPDADLYVWQDGEWHPDLESTHELSPAQAALAYELVHRTLGGVRVSMCPLPRHAVVFFDADDEPIASVNVCFECGDILVWPPYHAEGDAGGSEKEELMIAVKSDDGEHETSRISVVYTEAIVHWKGLFSGLGVRLTPYDDEDDDDDDDDDDDAP